MEEEEREDGLNLDGGRSRNDPGMKEGGGRALIERQEESAGNRPRAVWLVQSTS